ncbi:hypothetical protein AB0F24_18500 [Streptomyces platensis]|uniref:hypothetical protein n=1 Tax=Streptomyces platensis TaxID=58346 RepID=UPI0033DE619C
MHATPSPSSPPPPTYAPYGQSGNAAAPPSRPKSPPPPSDWDPAPPRSRAGLIVRHVCTLLYFPFHVLLLIVLFAAVYAFGLVGELLIFFDKPMLRLLEWALDPFPFRPRWWVTPRELRHERAGDPEFYRGWVGEQLGRPKPAVTTTFIRFHVYRGIGARGLLEVAAEHGWQPDPDRRLRPLRQVHLIRTARPDTR